MIRCCSVAKLRPLLGTPWTATHQAPLSVEFSRQEYWSRLAFHFPGDLPDPGIKPESFALTGALFTPGPPGKPLKQYSHKVCLAP